MQSSKLTPEKRGNINPSGKPGEAHFRHAQARNRRFGSRKSSHCADTWSVRDQGDVVRGRLRALKVASATVGALLSGGAAWAASTGVATSPVAGVHATE